eukprot:11175765-Lingulodinium_polyedra.AAC.1
MCNGACCRAHNSAPAEFNKWRVAQVPTKNVFVGHVMLQQMRVATGRKSRDLGGQARRLINGGGANR